MVYQRQLISKFTDLARQVASHRDRRVLLAGDVVHVHPSMGGQGVNLGVQDAVNFGRKLVQVVHGISPESLLETYHAERHPIGARVLRNTMALTVVDRGDDRIGALREVICELQIDVARKQYLAMMSGLDIHYDLDEGHPLLGRRMPDFNPVTSNGPLRVFTLLLRPARAPQPRWTWRLRHRSMGGSRSVDRREIRWYVGPSSNRGWHGAERRVDSARRGMWRGWAIKARRGSPRTNHLVWGARCRVARTGFEDRHGR